MDARPKRRIHRGKRGRSRQARERRALDSALRAAPSVGVRQEREARFHPNHERKQFPLDARIPDSALRDQYFIESPGVKYVEVCDEHFATGHGYDEHCSRCRSEYIFGRSP